MPPAATPILALPYPLPTDPVAHGADDFKALADRLEALGKPVVMRRSQPATQSIPHNAVTPVHYGNNDLDKGGIIYTIASRQWVVPVAGLYLLRASIQFATNATGRRALSVQAPATIATNDIPGNATNHSILTVVVADLPANGSVIFAGFQNTGAALDLLGDTARMVASITRIG